jgi:hypothetical protein
MRGGAARDAGTPYAQKITLESAPSALKKGQKKRRGGFKNREVTVTSDMTLN